MPRDFSTAKGHSWRDSWQKSIDLIPAPLVFIASGITQYLGAAIASTILFAVMVPYAVAWWRVFIAAILLLAIRRPWRRQVTKKLLISSGIMGISIIAMNMTFYTALSALPLGTCVSIEFIGPVVVALWRGHGFKVRFAAVLAAAGVVSISGLGIDLSQPEQRWGLFFALLAGLGWAGYIIFGQKLAAAGSGMDSLAWGFAIASLVTFPFTFPYLSGGLQSGKIFLACVGVAILSAFLPFPIEQVALRRLGPDIFALLTCLEPALSVVIGVIVLHQIPNYGEIIGFWLITFAVALTNYRPGMFYKHRQKRKGKYSSR